MVVSAGLATPRYPICKSSPPKDRNQRPSETCRTELLRICEPWRTVWAGFSDYLVAEGTHIHDLQRTFASRLVPRGRNADHEFVERFAVPTGRARTVTDLGPATLRILCPKTVGPTRESTAPVSQSPHSQTERRPKRMVGAIGFEPMTSTV